MSRKTRFYGWCRKPEPTTSKFLRVYAKPVIAVTTVAATVLLVSALLMTTIFSQTMAVSLLNPDSSSSNPTTQPEQTLGDAKPTITSHNTLNNPDSTVQPGTNRSSTTASHIDGYVTTAYMLPFTKAVDGEITCEDCWDNCPSASMGSQAEFRAKRSQVICNGETYKPLDADIGQKELYTYREFLIENFADTTQDAGDYWEICIDTKGDSGITPQIDDLRIVITGHNQVTWYQGTSEGWAPLIQPQQNLMQWKDTLSASPTSSIPHWICEVRLDDRILDNLGAANTWMWIRIAAFDASDNTGVQAWPPTSEDKPSDWGTLKFGGSQSNNHSNDVFDSYGDMYHPFVLDGKWTTSDEWKYVGAYKNDGYLVYRQEWNHYSLDDGSTFFVYDYSLIEELRDTTLDVGDTWQLCIDSLNDGGATPHPDDYRVDIIGHTTAVWYRGNGTGWMQIPSPSPDIFQWSDTLCSSPLFDIPHLICEFKIDKLALFGVVADYGLRVATYDAHNNRGEAYPGASRIDEPDTWGGKNSLLSYSPRDRTIPLQFVPNPTPTPIPAAVTIPTLESTPQWVINFSGYTDVAKIIQTSDGGYVIIGTIEEPTNNAFLTKIDSEGKIIWNKTYSDPTLNSNDIRVYEGIQTIDGGFAFAGRLGSDAWIVKTDSMGNLQWNQTFDHLKNQKYPSGSTTFDYPYYSSCVDLLVQIDNGEYKIRCSVAYVLVRSVLVFQDALIRLDSSGTLLSTDWNGTETFPLTTSDGGTLKVTGGTTLTKFDSTGQIEWIKTCPAPIDHIIQSADGGFVTADWDGKESNSPTTLTKIDADGMTVWIRTIDFVIPLSLLQTDDGYMITGYNCSTFTGVIVKTDLNGNAQWKQEYSNYVEKIINTQDAGFLMVTYQALPNTQRIYSIVKMV